jgi:hypothetical protein
MINEYLTSGITIYKFTKILQKSIFNVFYKNTQTHKTLLNLNSPYFQSLYSSCPFSSAPHPPGPSESPELFSF